MNDTDKVKSLIVKARVKKKKIKNVNQNCNRIPSYVAYDYNLIIKNIYRYDI